MAAVAGVTACSGAHAAGTSGLDDGLLTAGSITVDGQLGDWGVSAPATTDGNTWWVGGTTQGAVTWEDGSGGGYVGPGYGGQDFDLEALYTGFDASTNSLYVAFATGFGIEGEESGGTDYFAGDVFIDFGNDIDDYDNDWNSTGSPGRWDLAFSLDGVAHDDTTVDVIGAPSFTYADSPAVGVPGFNSGPLQATGGTNYGNASFAYTGEYTGGSNYWGSSNHNIYEFCYQLTGPQGAIWRDLIVNGDPGFSTGGWTAHWTMSCGNDFLDTGANLPAGTSLTPVVPVPAAAPMALLGMAIVGAVRRNRKK